MSKITQHAALLAISAVALAFAGSGARIEDGKILLSIPHFIPVALASFPLGTAGLALWLCDPLNPAFGTLAGIALLLAPALQLRLWRKFHKRTRASAVRTK